MGDAPRTNTRCNGFDSEDKCLRMAACHWVVTDDPYECVYITTTATPPSPGCCMLEDTRKISYEMGWDGQCTEFYTEEQCTKPYTDEGGARCVWVETVMIRIAPYCGRPHHQHMLLNLDAVLRHLHGLWMYVPQKRMILDANE